MVHAGFTLAIKKGGGGRGGAHHFYLGSLFTLLTQAIGPQKTQIVKYAIKLAKKRNGHYASVYFCGEFSQLGRNFFAENENKETKK
jgi:hypothetical protein